MTFVARWRVRSLVMNAPVALITGAGRGIGRAAAIELAGAGYDVALLARTENELSETARLAGRGLIISADVTRHEQVEQAVAKTVEAFGRLDAVVHCAGLAPMKSIDQMPVAEWRAVLDTNLS